ncbi:MAG TPA: hypothetical protein VMU94_18590 [Streptosporangiaceae bacterium]|nr:hypothetical protein [Streptosporangiaceae bacterium]
MARGYVRIVAGAGFAVALLAVCYQVLWRYRCQNWGATPDEVALSLPGDELMPDADVVTTRVIAVRAPPEVVWPWIVQMGSGRAGAYTYDWLENLFGLDMHSADVILPQFQDVAAGQEFPLASGCGVMRVEGVDPERAYVLRFPEARLVWIFALRPEGNVTRLVSRNRIRTPVRSAAGRLGYALIMEPGSLIRERKMLLGIRERAERLASDRQQVSWPRAVS